MKVLAIDSAMNVCQACVCEIADNEICVLAQENLETTRGQAERLIPMIEYVMENSRFSYNDLDLIGVINGPGAFTGMRVAIATAKGIALAAEKPVIGVPTIDAIMDSYLNYYSPGHSVYPYYAVILETKRKDYYFQMFEMNLGKKEDRKNIIESTPAMVSSASDISSIIQEKDVFLIGNASNRFKDECNHNWPYVEIVMPDSISIAKLAVKNFQSKGDRNGCKPVYLRGAEIGKSKKKQRVIKA